MNRRAACALILFCLTALGAPRPALASDATSTLDARVPEADSRSFGVGVEPLWLLIGGLGAEFDARLTTGTSLELAGMWVPGRQQGSTDSYASYKLHMYEVYAGPKFMLTGTYGTRGWYLFPSVGYTGVSITDYSSSGYSGATEGTEERLTAGYQWVVDNMRVIVGGGARAVQISDIVVRDGSGREMDRESAQTLAGLALDLNVSFTF